MRREKCIVLSVKGLSLDRQQSQIWNYFHKKTAFINACAKCSGLPSDISTMVLYDNFYIVPTRIRSFKIPEFSGYLLADL